MFVDRGQLLGERGMIGHSLRLDDELVRVPLIPKPASGTALPRTYAEQIQLTGVFRLLMELSGLEAGPGGSILASVKRGAPVRKLAFARVHHAETPELRESAQWQSTALRMVRTDTLRAVREADGHLSLSTIGACERAPDPASMPSLFRELDTFEHGSQPGGPVRVRRDVLKRLRCVESS